MKPVGKPIIPAAGRKTLSPQKWAMIAAYLTSAVILLTYRVPISAWLQADMVSWPHELMVLAAAFIIALVPAIPYTIAAALIGAKYGPAAGSLINLAISVSAAMVLFLAVRFTLTEEQRSKAAGIRGVSRLTAFAERKPFQAVLFARLLPVAPAQAVNIYAALTRMNTSPFFIATMLGKIPFLVTMSLLGHEIFQPANLRQTVLTAAAYVIFLLVVLLVYRIIQSRIN